MSLFGLSFSVLRVAANIGLALVVVLYTASGLAVAKPVPVIVLNTVPTSLDQTAAPRVPTVLSLPGGDQGVVLYSSSRWRLIRHVPSGYLDVYRKADKGSWHRMALDLEWRRNTHPMLAMESPQGLFVVGYDVVANLPSGRRVGVAREGFDLYLLDPTSKGKTERLPFAGVMDFGANNLEGRVAWSQTYYLQGLVSLLRAHPVTDAALLEAVRARLVAETEHTAQLAGDVYPGLTARRYSIDREPLLFALHLARVAHLLGNMRAAGISTSSLNRASSILHQKLLKLDETVERQVSLSAEFKGLRTLAYRRGVPFWADGTNVPHNFVSGYLSGLLANGDEKGVRHARKLAKFILVAEFGEKLPVSWRYWAATGDAGWPEQAGVSLNTPVWAGNGGASAHITYRSMDAVALAKLQRLVPDSVPRKLVEHFGDLAKRGWLLPFVNEELRIQGRARMLDAEVGRYYSRSAAAWELQSQVAALRSMARAP